MSRPRSAWRHREKQQFGDVVVAVTVTGDRYCKATDGDYRLDTTFARDFLDDFVSLP
jgi:hypothetical protein